LFTGNLYIHELTEIASSKLNIVIRPWEGVEVIANYSQFSVGNYAEQYKLMVKYATFRCHITVSTRNAVVCIIFNKGDN